MFYRRSAPLIVALVAALLVAAGTARAQGPVFSDPLLKDRNTVEKAASQHIGSSYACAVVTADETHPSRLLLIYVTSAEGAQRADAVRGSLDNPDQAKIRIIDKRYRASRLERIREAALAHPKGGVGIGGGRIYHRRCPRVELTIAPRGAATRPAEKWAKRLVRRFGHDRVVVHRGTVTTL